MGSWLLERQRERRLAMKKAENENIKSDERRSRECRKCREKQ
jgi:hypothetical protein